MILTIIGGVTLISCFAKLFTSILNNPIKHWGLTVNVEKTKIILFRKGGIVDKNESWTYGGQEIEIMNCFNYLGIVLSSGGAFVHTTKALDDKALKSMFSLCETIKETKPLINVMFNCLILWLLLY